MQGQFSVDQKAIDWELVDLVDMMLATGLRIGETAGISWPALDLRVGTVEVRGTVIRITGQRPDHQGEAEAQGRQSPPS